VTIVVENLEQHMNHPYKSQALAEIRTHLEQNGPRDWDPLRHRMNFVGQATFWRWVRQVKAQIPSDLIATSARHWVGDRASTSRGAGRRFDFLGAYHGLWADATRLRMHALHNDGKTVRDPAILDRSIRVRLRLIEQALQLEAEISSAAAQKNFYDGLVAEVGAESPALRERILHRLRAYSEQFATQQSGGPEVKLTREDCCSH
jgi:hypothetical protein